MPKKKEKCFAAISDHRYLIRLESHIKKNPEIKEHLYLREFSSFRDAKKWVLSCFKDDIAELKNSQKMVSKMRKKDAH